jgi:hypothetical protein
MRSSTTPVRITLLVVIVILVLSGFVSSVSAKSPEATASQSNAETGPAGAEREVVLYYFHGTRRCNTCRKVESYAQQAVETKFSDELQVGALQWKVLNTDEEVNAHFLKDFELVSSSLVVVEMNGGDVIRHDVLQDAWTLVRDESRFIEYIQKSVGEYLE